MKTLLGSTLASVCILVGAFASLHSSLADEIALTFDQGAFPIGFKQNDGTAGWEFAVNEPIYVTALGLFDYSLDGFTEAHAVGIWDLGGNLLVSATIPEGTTAALDGLFRFVDVTSTPLGIGSYAIGAYFLDQSPDGFPQQVASVTTHSTITFVQPRFSAGNTLAFPSSPQGPINAEGEPNYNHFGPSFRLAPVTVDVPETMNTAGAVLLAFSVMCWMRRKRNQAA